VGFLLLERAYAKINLTLDVLGKREDGYHEVDMVMQTVDMSDLLWIEEIAGHGVEVESNVSHIPRDNRNLAVAAAHCFQAHSGIDRGLRIRIEKQIPVAAGLAGGSADAAAVLRGLNRLWKTGYSADELAYIGGQIGSDVPFCVYGGCAIARGRGERIERVNHDFKAWVVLIKPPVFVSTADVYRAMSSSDYVTKSTSGRMVHALRAASFDEVQELVGNGMRATTERLYPEVQVLRQRIENVSMMPVFMSGSGPTLFSLVPAQSTGQRLYNALRGFTREVYLCRLL